MPPITMFDVFSRLSHTVYTTTYENIPTAIKNADTGFSAKYPYTTDTQLTARPYASTCDGAIRPDGMGLVLVLFIMGSMSRS